MLNRMKFINRRKMLANCTLLISGPLTSTVKEDQLLNAFSVLNELKNRYGLKIVVSTYSNELTPALRNFQFRFVLNGDPGKDCYYTGLAILGSKTNKLARNTTRMLNTTSLGLSQVKTEYVIKTRVEILPSKIEFAQVLNKILEDYLESEIIVFLAEHYTGLAYSEKKPLLLWIPDGFQIMRTSDCLKLWEGALELWQKYRTSLVGNFFHVDLANEQLLGLSLVHNFIKPISERSLKRYHRYTCSLKFIRANLKFERQMFKSVYYDALFLGEGRFRWNNKTSPTIAMPIHQTVIQKYLTVLNFLVRGRFFLLRSAISRLIHFILRYNRALRSSLNK
jgi:hypothetical protein